MKKYLLIIALGSIFGLTVGYYMFVSEQVLISYTKLIMFLLSCLGTLLVGVNWKITKILDRFFLWNKSVEKRLLVGVLSHFICSVVLSISFVYFYFFVSNETYTFSNQDMLMEIKLGIIILILSIVFQVVYFALYTYVTYSNFQIEELRQERKQIEYQLNALKSQLSPHFLFNSLNSISALIYKDISEASVFIRKLTQMYDSILQSYHQKLIHLEEELKLGMSYNYLLSSRFKDKFYCRINIPKKNLSSSIPPLTIQMLLENAVKHNVLSLSEPLNISIYTDKDFIIVENNITSSPINVNSLKVGLKNINSRYKLLAGKEIIIEKGDVFKVKLPIIR